MRLSACCLASIVIALNAVSPAAATSCSERHKVCLNACATRYPGCTSTCAEALTKCMSSGCYATPQLSQCGYTKG